MNPFYKWETGQAACKQCVLPATINVLEKTCIDANDVQVTQEITLKAGKNYISFYVFTPGLKVVDIFNKTNRNGPTQYSS